MIKVVEVKRTDKKVATEVVIAIGAIEAKFYLVKGNVRLAGKNYYGGDRLCDSSKTEIDWHDLYRAKKRAAAILKEKR